ncbi:helix-turn-helix domain-containing protein [Streptomyces sp. BK340]|uniref:helix-turn-helix domain-containing protein n=1 Tax=Streptomyces sp. BK340 TaxID=2572903 RepID=UPI0011A83361|nr:helix-turn-helix domain-containing protein [Streptomyces sp. BK340]
MTASRKSCQNPLSRTWDDNSSADVGLSPPRLRALVHASVGVPLARLRQWARLRVAVAELPRESAASAAAVAGFADQAHFTRTARSLLGRTPASIGRSPRLIDPPDRCRPDSDPTPR